MLSWLHFTGRHILHGRFHKAEIERRSAGQNISYYICILIDKRSGRPHFAQVKDSYQAATAWCEHEVEYYDAKEAASED